MNALGTILLSAVLVVGGLLAYDATRPDEPQAPPAGTFASPAAAAHDAGVLTDLDVRLARLERRLVAQRREIAELRGRPSAVPPPAEQAAAFLEPPRRKADGTLAIAPETLDALRAYVAEADRRIRAEHRRGLVEASIARLKLDLREEEHDHVLRAVTDYHAKTQTFWTDMQRRGITERPQQMAELAAIRQTLVDAIQPLVPKGDMDRVIDGLIGRGAIPPGRPVRRRPWER